MKETIKLKVESRDGYDDGAAERPQTLLSLLGLQIPSQIRYFPVFLFIPSLKLSTKNETIYIYKGIIDDEAMRTPNHMILYKNDWTEVEVSQRANQPCKFLGKFIIRQDSLS